MTEDNDDRPLGVPVMRARFNDDISFPEERETALFESAVTDQGRHPDDEIGLAKQLPSETHETTAHEKAAVEAAESSATRKLYDQAIKVRFGHFQQWGRLADRTLLLAILSLAAFCSLIVFSQTVQILAAVSVQPTVLQCLSYAGLAVIFVILALFSIRLVFLLFRLRVNQQVSEAQLRELSGRAELRALAERDKAQAKKNLESYLRNYPYDQMCFPATPGGFRLGKDSVISLQGSRDYLLDKELFSDYDGWLNNFCSRFQDQLENSANQIVSDWTKVVAIKTAISRWPLLDSIIVLYCSYAMIGDLCRLYNLRMSGPGIGRLLVFTLFNTYVAGQIEEHAGAITDAATGIGSTIGDTLSPGISETIATKLPHLLSAVPQLGALLKAAGKSVGDGVANALLMRKLGRTTIALLRPINPN